MKLYQIAEKKGVGFTFDKERSKALLDSLKDGTYLISYQILNPQSEIKDYHRLYFAKLDALAAETGHSKAEMHELVKEYVLSNLVKDLPELYEQPEFRPNVSVLGLTDKGWIVFIEQFELWAFSEFGTVLN